MNELKVGDIVHITGHPNRFKRHEHCPSWNRDMDEYLGRDARVTGILHYRRFSIDIDAGRFTWATCMTRRVSAKDWFYNVKKSKSL